MVEEPSNHRLQPGGTEYGRYKWVRDQISWGARVLDVGCNCGQLAENLTLDIGCAVVGVDIEPEFVAHCQQAKERYGRFVCADFGAMAGEEVEALGQFDVVTALEVIEHPLDIRRFRENVGEVLSLGGKLIITTPHPESPITGYEFLRSYEPHVRMWTRWRLGATFGPAIEFSEIVRDCGTLLSIGAVFLNRGEWA